MTVETVRAVTVARAALMEAGRPDLAADIYPYGDGWPGHGRLLGWCHSRLPDDSFDIVLRAVVLGHQAAGHPVNLYVDPKCGHTHLRWPVPA